MVAIEFPLKGTLNELIPAFIRPIILTRDILSWTTSWFPEMYDLAGERLHEDSHWNVPKIWEETHANDNYRVMVIEAEGLIQGYTVVRAKNYLGIDGNPCGHIAFVAVAPWNRALKGGRRKIKGVGRILVGVSSFLSLKYTNLLNLELYSLPDAEGFYHRIGMRATGRISHEGLKEFRLETPEALALVRPLLPHIIKREK
jgi:hypothetical protein